MANVPTLKEMGLGDEEFGDSRKRVYRYDWKKKSGKEDEEYLLLNGILFLSFVVPALFAVILRADIYRFYYFIMMWIHEAGHGFFCMFGCELVCATMGFGMEMLVTAIPAGICLRDRRSYTSGFVLLMCVGFSLQYNGGYMQTARYPHGTSLAGLLTREYDNMNRENHDYSIIYSYVGDIKNARRNGLFMEGLGQTLSTTLLLAAIINPIFYGGSKRHWLYRLSSAAIPALILLYLADATQTQLMLAAALTTPYLAGKTHDQS